MDDGPKQGTSSALPVNPPPTVRFEPDVAIALNTRHYRFLRWGYAIKRMAPQACIVVLSSHDSTEYKEASIRKGANFFLSKERSGGLRLLDVIHETIQGNRCA